MARQKIIPENPWFTYGSLAVGTHFANRTKERQKLTDCFVHGINVILISPRRWGKSSLVLETANYVEETYEQRIFVHIDLFEIRSEDEFYETLAREIIRQTESAMEARITSTRKFLSRLVPKITIPIDGLRDFSVGLDMDEVRRNPDDVLNLAERIAEEKDVRIIVCMDEFQNIAHFGDSTAFQKKLRSYWQRHKNVSYCLFGSKRHMMLDVFTNPEMPFYRFGEIVFLEKIAEEHWVNFLKERFSASGKSITESAAKRITQLVDNHSQYVQQLAQQAWFHTKKVCTDDLVDIAFDEMMRQASMLFKSMSDSLSATQLHYLSAMIDGVTSFSSKETIQKYGLGTSANVARIKQALMQKEVVDFVEQKAFIIDPLFRAWLITYYFKKKHINLAEKPR